MAFYDGTGLLSQKDINGQVPEIFLCTSNRSAGKTTYFARLLVNRWKKDKSRKFMLVYRFKYELSDVSNKFFKDIGELFFKDMTMTDEPGSGGLYKELFINEEPCGYAISLNSADQLKKMSHLFSDTDSMMFDEFMSEQNHYCPLEVEKLISIHTSVARGQGKQVRYVPIYMISNPVSLINPYYTTLGISSRLNKNTKFLRGDGWVLEQGFNESASTAQSQSAFNRAFSSSNYMAYNTQAVYLNDNQAFIEKVSGNGKYTLTLRFRGQDYGVVEYSEQGIIYITDKADSSFGFKLAITTDDFQVNYVLLQQYKNYLAILRQYFEKGCFRFKNLMCKEALMAAIGYR